MFAVRREYRTAIFLYLIVATLPLRGGDLFHAAPFVLFCIFLVGILLEEAASLPRPWKIALLTFCSVPTLLLAVSGARYVARHALQSDFDHLMAEAQFIKEAAQNHRNVQLGHYPDGDYMYYLTGYRPLSKFVDFYPWVAEIARSSVDADLARAREVILVMDLTGNVWTFPNYVTLESEAEYAKQHLVKERFGWLTVWVSPSLASRGNAANQVDFEELGAALPDAPAGHQWRLDPRWLSSQNRERPRAGPGLRDLRGQAGHWIHPSRPLPSRPNARHRDPIARLVGLDDRNLSVVVRDAASKKVLAQMDHPPALYANWWAWRPKLPHDADLNVEVVAETWDNGPAANEWLALAWPTSAAAREEPDILSSRASIATASGVSHSDIEHVEGPATKVYRISAGKDDLPVTGDCGTAPGKTGNRRLSPRHRRMDPRHRVPATRHTTWAANPATSR